METTNENQVRRANVPNEGVLPAQPMPAAMVLLPHSDLRVLPEGNGAKLFRRLA
jgi:hypothetical protein